MWLCRAYKRQTPSLWGQAGGLVVGRAGTWVLADGAHEVVDVVFRQLPTNRSPVRVPSESLRELAAVSENVCCLRFLISDEQLPLHVH